MHINAPINRDEAAKLRAGDIVEISGIIYTARDAAHKRMCDTLKSGGELPFEIENAAIYYVGPCPCKEGEVIGSCGPTTSGRMDAYTPMLLDRGLCAMIGKGKRNDAVKKSIIKNSAVYLGAIGGAGALLAKHVVKSEVIAYDDLGTEAVRKLTVKNFPVTVIIDSLGNDLYEIGKNKYKVV